MAGFGIKVTGLTKTTGFIIAQGEKSTTAMEVGLFTVANEIFNKSQKLVPVDTGALRGSGSLKRLKQRFVGSTMLISYGGPAAPYALKVHEDVNMRHAPPTQAKYLEEPYMEAKNGIKAKVEAAVAAALKL
jgi:hypothetical protein